MIPRRLGATLAVVAAAIVGCGQTSSAPTTPPGVRTPPSIAALLRHPVATPTACTTQRASSTGLTSPWQGHVDISVYLKPSDKQGVVRAVGGALSRATIAQKVYFESQSEAYKEFQRLYTCWAGVPRSQIPASYRVVLIPTATIAQRNTLVALMLRQPGVDSASCDPALPCTTIVQSASAAAHH